MRLDHIIYYYVALEQWTLVVFCSENQKTLGNSNLIEGSQTKSIDKFSTQLLLSIPTTATFLAVEGAACLIKLKK